MSKRTCGTCGHDGGYCEWMDDETHYCEVLQFDEDPEEPECDVHIRLRKQRERAEKAEAQRDDACRLAESAARGRKDLAERIAELEPWAEKGVEFAEYLHSDACKTNDALKARVAEMEGALQKLQDASSAVELMRAAVSVSGCIGFSKEGEIAEDMTQYGDCACGVEFKDCALRWNCKVRRAALKVTP